MLIKRERANRLDISAHGKFGDGGKNKGLSFYCGDTIGHGDLAQSINLAERTEFDFCDASRNHNVG